MPAGLMTFDSDGNELVSLTTRITKVLDTILITEDGIVTDNRLRDGNPWYACVFVKMLEVSEQWPDPPIIGPTLSMPSDNKIQYDFPVTFPGAYQFRLTYGIY